MNNLTKRKIVLGLLMMVVLAFSVQGTADAAVTGLARAATGSGHGAKIRANTAQTFTFTIATADADDTLTLTLSRGTITGASGTNLSYAAPTLTVDSGGITSSTTITVNYTAPATTGSVRLTVRASSGSPRSITLDATVVGDLSLTKSTNISTSRDHQTQVENRRLVNPLTFTIANVADGDEVVIAGNTINRIVIGSTEVYEDATGAATVTLSADAESDDLKLINGTAKVYCTLGDAGTHTFTVSTNVITFTAYAVQSRNDVESDVTEIAFSPAGADILYDTADQTATVALNTGQTYVEIEFRITGGSLYHPETPDSTNFKTTTTSSLTRFTAPSNEVTVKFRPSSSSNVQITARVVHKRELEAVKTYYYGDAVLDKVSGDDQTGRPNTQLTQPLVVRVENDRGTTVSGQVVSFSFDAGSAFIFSTPDSTNDRKQGRFRAVPGTTIYDSTSTAPNGLVDAEDHSSFRTPQNTLNVVSDRGRAEVYVVLNDQTETGSVLSTTSKVYYQPKATILSALPNTQFAHRAATQRFKATADPGRSRDTRDLSIVSGNNQNVAVRKYADPLVVSVESNGNVVQEP